MIQPIREAINWFLGFYLALPFSFQAFIGIVVVLFGVAVIIKLLFHVR